MRLIQIDHNPSRRQLAVFGVTWLAVFGVVGGIVLKTSESLPVATAVWAFAVALPIVGWFVPSFLRIVYVSMACAAFPIGFVVSHLMMATVYYGVLTPIGVVMRLFGYDPINRHFDQSDETYWRPRSQENSLNTYFRQF